MKFKFGDKVEIVKGFFTGHVGYVGAYNEGKTGCDSYYVEFMATIGKEVRIFSECISEVYLEARK